jgi:hypothetical protein
MLGTGTAIGWVTEPPCQAHYVALILHDGPGVPRLEDQGCDSQDYVQTCLNQYRVRVFFLSDC